MIAQKDFWDAPEKTTGILKERTFLTNRIGSYQELVTALEDNELLLAMALEENDQQTLDEVHEQIASLEKSTHAFSIGMMLDGEHDANNAIVSINAGAGGTDAQDWADIMLRMYLRWAEQHGFKSDIIDLQPGDEAGTKSATFTVKGQYAYGYLKSEIGVHRLVRISPFNVL